MDPLPWKDMVGSTTNEIESMLGMLPMRRNFMQ